MVLRDSCRIHYESISEQTVLTGDFTVTEISRLEHVTHFIFQSASFENPLTFRNLRSDGRDVQTHRNQTDFDLSEGKSSLLTICHGVHDLMERVIRN